MLNKQGEGKIDWTDYTWNPISGCLHGCDYCYLKRLEERFGFDMKPKLHVNRLNDVEKLKSPSKIFVGSSADMWGEWVPEKWIEAILDICRKYPQHIFQFLTKNPASYIGWRIPSNCWLGTTIDGTSKTTQNIHTMKHLSYENVRFISYEPLLQPIDINSFDGYVDWIIIGANSNKGAEKPPNSWADRLVDVSRLCSVKVFIKDNYKYHTRIKEFPLAKQITQ